MKNLIDKEKGKKSQVIFKKIFFYKELSLKPKKRTFDVMFNLGRVQGQEVDQEEIIPDAIIGSLNHNLGVSNYSIMYCKFSDTNCHFLYCLHTILLQVGLFKFFG